jgi:hypothetical protein
VSRDKLERSASLLILVHTLGLLLKRSSWRVLCVYFTQLSKSVQQTALLKGNNFPASQSTVSSLRNPPFRYSSHLTTLHQLHSVYTFSSRIRVNIIPHLLLGFPNILFA